MSSSSLKSRCDVFSQRLFKLINTDKNFLDWLISQEEVRYLMEGKLVIDDKRPSLLIQFLLNTRNDKEFNSRWLYTFSFSYLRYYHSNGLNILEERTDWIKDGIKDCFRLKLLDYLSLEGTNTVDLELDNLLEHQIKTPLKLLKPKNTAWSNCSNPPPKPAKMWKRVDYNLNDSISKQLYSSPGNQEQIFGCQNDFICE